MLSHLGDNILPEAVRNKVINTFVANNRKLL